MNQNLTYTAYTGDPRGGGSSNAQATGLPFHPTFHPTSTYTTSTTPFHGTSTSFIPGGTGEYKRIFQMPGSSAANVQSQSNSGGMRLATPSGAESDDRRIAALLDSYFIDTPGGTWGGPSGNNSSSAAVSTTQAAAPLTGSTGASNANYAQVEPSNLVVKKQPSLSSMTPEKRDKERSKRMKQAEAARLRYHRLSAEEKRELNMKRTLAQKRKRQREKELEELESILRESNDIQEDPEVTDQLRERRMRAKWAEAARQRYQRMSSEERRAHNNKRRMRQMQSAIQATKAEGLQTGDPVKDEEAIRQHIKEQNHKKAEAARARYHRMSDDEKRVYNQRRTEAFRRRRMEEEMLLAMPIGRINGEALDRAQQIVVRNAKRAEAARLRYQRMTPEQRKQYNQKRYTPKRKRLDGSDSVLSGSGMGSSLGASMVIPKKSHQGGDEELDALTTLERDVMKRTQQAQAQLARRSYNILPTAHSHLTQSNNQSSNQSAAAPSLIHQMQPQQMTYTSGNQGLLPSGSHMQPILNPYSGRP